MGIPEHRHEAAAAGFDAHVVKPVTPERLAEVLGLAARGQTEAFDQGEDRGR